MNILKAFIIGGIICAIVQIFIDKTKLMPGRIMVGLVVIGAILSAVGLYGPFADFAGAGASTPLIGFGHSLFKGVREAIDEYGFLGTFMGGFKASAVGISGALIFGFISSLLFKSKMQG